jgi:hypothetical protein
MNNLTSNVNFLGKVSFKLTLNSLEFANTQFFAVSASIPGVAISEATAGYRNQAGFVPGEKMMYDPLTIRIAVDENFASYLEIYRWMKSHTNQNDVKVIDMSLSILSSHNNPIQTFTFVNAFPTNIGQLDFDAQATDVEYLYMDVTFRYDYFKVSGLDDGGLAEFCG